MEIKENPIDEYFVKLYESSKTTINICVPFLSTFVKKIFKSEILNINKQIIVALDDNNLSSYNLEAFKYLIKLGFQIRYHNNIHLKLYIFDNISIITSSNLTENGFIKNIELSVVNKNNIDKEKSIFTSVWNECKENVINNEYINANWGKYLLLKSRANKSKEKPSVVQSKKSIIKDLDVEKLKDYLIKRDTPEFIKINERFIIEANKILIKRIIELKQGYDAKKIYVQDENSLRRKDCLFHDLQYGSEVHLATTGLREHQFRDAFQDRLFKNVIEYLIPESVSIRPWNLEDDDEFYELSKGIFNFRIKQYVEILPIRLVSYFYPEYFLPIFKLEHFEKAANVLGMDIDMKKKKYDLLYSFNKFFSEKFREIPVSNYIKSMYIYSLNYTYEIYLKIKDGQAKENILQSYKDSEVWKQKYVINAYKRLVEIGIIG